MKQFYFLKLMPPRPTFVQDMTDAERAIMQSHVEYFNALMAKGVVYAFGPVLDPAGPYGVAVIGVESEAERDEIMAKDPSVGLNRFECFPMRAVVPNP